MLRISPIVRKAIKVTLIILIFAILIVATGLYLMDRSGVSSEEFGIYLLESNELFISDNEIVWYDKTSFQFKLTEEGTKKISSLEVPVAGSLFAARIDGEEIYTGSFWVSFSSLSYSGIVIDALRIQNNTIRIDLGYPSSQFFEGVDNRNDPRIIDHFQKLGKLKQ
jgi:hypothetical protein